MKKLILFFFPLFLLFPNDASAIKSALPQPIQQKSLLDLERTEVLNLDKKNLEQKLNRKLTFKEKIALPFIKRNLKKHPELSTAEAENYTKLHGLALSSFIVGIISIFFAGVILGICAITFSAIALNKIERFPDKFRGRGFAIAGAFLGAVGIVGAVIVLLRMMA